MSKELVMPRQEIAVPDAMDMNAVSYHLTIIELLKFEEGEVLRPYHDTEGFPTVGVGHKLSSTKLDNLDKFPAMISRTTSKEFLEEDLRLANKAIEHSWFYPRFKTLSYERKLIITSMCFQMGVQGVSKFKLMWESISDEDFVVAAAEMLDSQWARQTPERATRHANVMSTGNALDVYGALV